jgi:hypothetical protein
MPKIRKTISPEKLAKLKEASFKQVPQDARDNIIKALKLTPNNLSDIEANISLLRAEYMLGTYSDVEFILEISRRTFIPFVKLYTFFEHHPYFIEILLNEVRIYAGTAKPTKRITRKK